MSETTPATAAEISLQDLIYGFIGYALDRGKKTFPAITSRVWHEMLYEFTHAEEFGRFGLQKFASFSWDGTYPKSVYLQGVLRWLLTGGLCVPLLSDGRLKVVPKLEVVFANRLKRLQDYSKDLPIHMFAAACSYTGFFE